MFQVVWLNVSCISKLDPEASGGGLETVVFLFRIQRVKILQRLVAYLLEAREERPPPPPPLLAACSKGVRGCPRVCVFA